MIRAPEHILRDLGRKTSDDVSSLIRRNAALVGRNPQDLFFIALSAAGAAMGASIGFSQQCSPGTPEELADALWQLLRPISLIAAGGSEADFRELLRQAPNARSAK